MEFIRLESITLFTSMCVTIHRKGLSFLYRVWDYRDSVLCLQSVAVNMLVRESVNLVTKSLSHAFIFEWIAKKDWHQKNEANSWDNRKECCKGFSLFISHINWSYQFDHLRDSESWIPVTMTTTFLASNSRSIIVIYRALSFAKQSSRCMTGNCLISQLFTHW